MSGNSPSFNFWSLLRWLAWAIAPPALAIQFPIVQSLTHNRSLAIVFLAFYEVALFIISIINKIRQQVEEPWIKGMANALDQFVRNLLLGYYRHYRRYFFEEHRDLDVKGLSTQGTCTLDLEHVFVELRVNPKVPHEASADPLRFPIELRTGSHTIWEYLQAKPLHEEHLVVLGAPGSGKTTLLKHLGLALLYPRRFHHLGTLPYKLPLLLFLRDHSLSIQEIPEYTLAKAVHTHVLRKLEHPMPPEWIEQQLDKGRCLILLDGLDEVADTTSRQQTVAWVERQMTIYGKNRFVVTSRPFGYRSNPLRKVTILEVQPFTFKQVTRFVNDWYLANEIKSTARDDPGVRRKAKEGTQDLLRRLRETPALFALVFNPLLLTMVTTIHRYRGSLPGTRIILYKEICEVFLGKRQEARGIVQDLRADQRILVLQQLAYHMMQRKVLDISREEAEQIITEALQRVSTQMTPKKFLQSIENISGLLLEKEQGSYAFAHKTFQEYLAAVQICENGLGHVLVKQIELDWWHETIRLYCAQADATPIISACLAITPLSIEALKLAFYCLDDARDVRADVKHKLNILIEQYIESSNLEHRKLIAEVLLARRFDRMRLPNEQVVIDISFVTHIEYQLFLDEQQTQGKYYQPDHWADFSFPLGTGLKPVLGVRRSDALAFCEWLTAREEGNWYYRLPKSNEQEEDVVDKVSRATGTAVYWISTDTKPSWAAVQPLPSDITQECLDHSFKQDEEHFSNYSFNPDRSSDHILYKEIRLAQALRHACELDQELCRILQSVQTLIQTHAQTLQKDLEKAEQVVLTIQDKLKYELAINTSLRTEFTKAQREIFSPASELQLSQAQRDVRERQAQLERDEQHVSTLHVQLENAHKRFFFNKNRELEQNLQGELEEARKRKVECEDQLINAEQKEIEIRNRLELARQQESKHEAEFKNKDKDNTEKIDLLRRQLASAKQKKDQLELEIKHFRAGAHTIENICNCTLFFTHAYSLSEAFSNAINHNATLNLDSVFNIVKNSTFRHAFEDTSTQISNLALDYAQNLAQDLAAYNSDVAKHIQTKADNITQYFIHAQTIACELTQNYTSTDVQQLTDRFTDYLEYASKNRLELRRNSALRRYIRYFARMLVSHLQYWWWKEQESDIYRSIIDAYLDIYITFVILEKRIKGESSACEGILIVRELKKESLE